MVRIDQFTASPYFTMYHVALSTASVLVNLILAGVAHASPGAVLRKRSVTPLTASQLGSLAPFTQFARAAYCPISELRSWNCGGLFHLHIILLLIHETHNPEACAANANFQPTLVGGDGNDVQICVYQSL